MTIVNYASSDVNKLKASLNDDAIVVIYDHHMFIVQARGNTTGGSMTVLLTSSLVWISAFYKQKQKFTVVLQLILNQSNRRSMVQ